MCFNWIYLSCLSFNRHNYLLSRVLVNLLSINSILLLIINVLICIIILINRMRFIYYLHFGVLSVTRSHNLWGNLILLLLLGCLICRSLIIFGYLLLFLFILSCMLRNLIWLSLCWLLITTLFMFLICYFSDRLLLDVGHFEVILTLGVSRWTLLSSSIKLTLCVWLSVAHLVTLNLLKLRSSWRIGTTFHHFLPPFLFLSLLYLFLLRL